MNDELQTQLLHFRNNLDYLRSINHSAYSICHLYVENTLKLFKERVAMLNTLIEREKNSEPDSNEKINAQNIVTMLMLSNIDLNM